MKKSLISHSFIIALMAMLVFSLSSCSKTKLKTDVAKANAECPIKLAGLGEMTSISYEDGTVVFNYIIDDITNSSLNFSMMSSNKELMKENFILSIAQMDQTNKALIHEIVNANASLTINYKSKKTGESLSINVTNEELKNAASKGFIEGSTESNENSFKILENIVKAEQTTFPTKVAEGMNLTSSSLTKDMLTYNCTVDESIYDLDFIEQNATKAKSGILEGLLQDGDVGMKNTIKYLKACNISLCYNYVGSETGRSIPIIITPDEM